MAGRNLLLLLLISGTFMMDTLDGAVIATPLPLIARDLGVDPVQAKSALTSYFLAIAALIPLANWLSDRFGPRRVFATAIATFTLGSLLCAASPTLGVMVAARLVQGAGAAMMFPIGRMILVRSVSKKDLIRASTSVSILPALALVVGPLLAGYVATFFDWRLLFLINAPLGLAGIVLALVLVPKQSDAPPSSFDGPGFALCCGGIVAFGYGLSAAGGIWLSLAGALLLALYIRHARRTTSPILDLSLFRHGTFRIAVGGSFVVRAAVVGALPFLLPMLLQVGFGLTPFESGSITFIGAFATLLSRFVLGPLLRRLGFRSFLSGTAVFGALAMLFLAFVSETTSHLVVMAIIFTGTLLRVLQILGLEAMVFADVERSEMGQAACLLSVVKQLAAFIGVAYAGLAVQSAQALWTIPANGSRDFRLAIVLVAVPLALTALLAFRLSKDAGAEVAGRPVAAAAPSSSRP